MQFSSQLKLNQSNGYFKKDDEDGNSGGGSFGGNSNIICWFTIRIKLYVGLLNSFINLTQNKLN